MSVDVSSKSLKSSPFAFLSVFCFLLGCDLSASNSGLLLPCTTHHDGLSLWSRKTK